MYADAQISFALQVAYKRDVKLIRDSKAQAFFLEAMKWKKEHDADIRSKTEITSELQLLGSNLYQVAHYIADKQGLDQTERRRIYLEVARPILWKHRWAYFALFAEAFDSTITKITRLNKPPFPGFWTLSLIMLAMATFAWSRHSIVAIGLYAAHFAHLVIICLFDVPQQRYVFATEFMVIIGLIFLFIGCLVRARELADRYQRRKQEKIVDPSLQTPSLVR
jgi:hypothetical protein